jgi:hypothetical protein
MRWTGSCQGGNKEWAALLLYKEHNKINNLYSIRVLRAIAGQ